MANYDRKPIALPDQQTLIAHFEYLPEAGELIRIEDNSVIKGECHGYVIAHFKGVAYKAHRLIWKLVTGVDPDGLIDHINQIKNDNSWSNLRVVSNTENHQNRKLHANNTSGCPGVIWVKEDNSWLSRITVNGKRIRLGQFKDFNLAVRVRKEAESYYGFSPNHGRKAG